jgi:hypothetical protein
MNRCSQSITASADSIAAASSGRATATTSAPNASALAASIPVRIPPEATSGMVGNASRTSTIARAVGIPQSARSG